MTHMFWAATRNTFTITKKSIYLYRNKFLKIVTFGLFFVTQKHEIGIMSNRLLLCYGELYFKFCTYYTSRSEFWGWQKTFLILFKGLRL
jgi:uncharacterized membrane protein YhaH (DUF805 family)